MSTLKRYLIYLLLPLITLGLAGCSSQNANAAFERFLPTENVNQAIQLSEQKSQSNESPNFIRLTVTNQSQDLIRFPIDFGTHLYVYNEENGEWDEVGNNMTYGYSINTMSPEAAKEQIEKEGGVPLYPQGLSFDKVSTRNFSAEPVLGGMEFPVRVRVLVVGTVFKDNVDTGEKVAAFYDDMIVQPTGTPTEEACVTDQRVSVQDKEAFEFLPFFILDLWPYPGAQIAKNCYRQSQDSILNLRGIGAEVRTVAVDTDPNREGLQEIPYRTRLLIDDQEVTSETLQIAAAGEVGEIGESGNITNGMPSEYFLSWAPQLEVGEHEIRLLVTGDTGEVFEHTWKFTITQ